MATEWSPNNSPLEFHPVAKIVFEETREPLLSTGGNSDVTKWIWGGVDLCCLPSGQDNISQWSSPDSSPTTATPSSVRFVLPLQDEYQEALESLQGSSQWLSPEIVQATLFVKMGEIRPGLGLAAIPLS